MGLARLLTVRENAMWPHASLLPLLVLPVMAPVLLAATRSFEAALAGTPGEAVSWLGVLAAFAVLYVVVGLFGFGPLLEES